MAKYTEENINRIIELYETGEYTDKDICKIVGIHQDTFITWKHDKPEFSELLKDAESRRYESIKAMAIGGLKKALTGHTYTETTRELNEDGELVVVKEVDKYSSPNPTSIIFALTNQDSKNFQDRRNIDITSKNKEITYTNMSDEQLIKLANSVTDEAKQKGGESKQRRSSKGGTR